MRLLAIGEAKITDIADKGKAAGRSVLGMAADIGMGMIPGAGTAAKAGELTLKIVDLIKTKRDAQNLILKAMSLPDSNRDELNIFDVDDDLWGPEGILNDRSKTEIFKLVKGELDRLVAAKGTLPPNFANNIAVKYVKSKIKESSI